MSMHGSCKLESLSSFSCKHMGKGVSKPAYLIPLFCYQIFNQSDCENRFLLYYFSLSHWAILDRSGVHCDRGSKTPSFIASDFTGLQLVPGIRPVLNYTRITPLHGDAFKEGIFSFKMPKPACR